MDACINGFHVTVSGVKFSAALSTTRKLARRWASSADRQFDIRVSGAGQVTVNLTRPRQQRSGLQLANLPVAFTNKMSIEVRQRPIPGTGQLEI